MNIRKTLSRVALVGFALAACAGPGATTPARSSPTPPAQGSATPVETATAPPAVTPSQFSLAALQSLSPLDILVQQDYEPTFFRPEAFFEFGRVPPFTLLADGTVIYVDESRGYDQERLMKAQLSPEETVALVQQVLDLGIERLESYTEDCWDQADGTRRCVADAAFTILRVRLPEGELREVKIFAEFTPIPEVLENIRSFLTDYEHPDAEPYVPERAALFIRPLTEVTGVTVQDWPLEAGRLTDVRPAFGAAFVLEGEELTRFLAAVPRNTGDFWFEHNGQFYNAFLVPWLPGVDYADELLAEFPPPGPPDATTPVGFSECPISRGDQGPTQPAGLLRLAFIDQGNTSLWDEGKEPISISTSGDVQQVKLSADGKTVAFTRKVGESIFELWAVPGEGGELRRLAGGADLTGTIRILSFSGDGQMVAFTHQVDEHSEELWAADTDGAGARLLVSVDDLMELLGDLPEPLGVTPAAASWIPNTYTLTCDAFPVYDGIFIYVQGQVWVVDAVSGQQGVAFPRGEGGQISYSPDGTQMAIITPGSLSLMNVEGRDRREAALDYQAVGMGEYYFFPWPAWSPDSQSLLLALPADDQFAIDGLVTIWRVSADGSEATPLAEFTGFAPSFAFSHDLSKVAYWRAAPESNTRELHIASVDGSEDILYDTAGLIEFMGWSPDSQHFLYTSDADQTIRKDKLGHICEEAVMVSLAPVLYDFHWMDANRFLFLGGQPDSEELDLYLGTLNGAITPLVRLEEFGKYDFVVIPAR